MLTADTILNGRYQLQHQLGVGGFSEVWFAHDVRTGRDVAIKAFFRQNTEGIQICRREYEQANRLYHPRLIRLYDFDVYQQMPYLVMPYYRQGSLSERAGSLEETTLWRVICDIGSALTYLHGLYPPMLHNDLKPDNFLVTDDETEGYILTDFGISAELTDHLQRSRPAGVAPLAYRAPELFAQPGQPVQAVKASDIWAFGACLYELAAGETPFGEQGGVYQLMQHEDYGYGVAQIVAPLPAHYSSRLVELIHQCLHVEPWRRPKATDLVETARHELHLLEHGWNPVAPPWVAEPLVAETWAAPTALPQNPNTDFSFQVRMKRRNVLIGMIGVLGVLMGLLFTYLFAEKRAAKEVTAQSMEVQQTATPANTNLSAVDPLKEIKKDVLEANQPKISTPTTSKVVKQPAPPETFKDLLDRAIADTRENGVERQSLYKIRNNIGSASVVCQNVGKLDYSTIVSVQKVVDYAKKNICPNLPAPKTEKETPKVLNKITEDIKPVQKGAQKWGIQFTSSATLSTGMEQKRKLDMSNTVLVRKEIGYALIITYLNKTSAEQALPDFRKSKDCAGCFVISYREGDVVE